MRANGNTTITLFSTGRRIENLTSDELAELFSFFKPMLNAVSTLPSPSIRYETPMKPFEVTSGREDKGAFWPVFEGSAELTTGGG